MLKKMVGEGMSLSMKSRVDLSKLPPCADSLLPHIQRMNHRVRIFKMASVPIYESPKPYEENKGWMKNETGQLEPVWSISPCLPTSLVDLYDAIKDNKDSEEDEQDEDTDIEISDSDSDSD